MEAISLTKDNYDTLDELFEEWEKAHENDKYYEKTFPSCPCCGVMPTEEFKTSFTYDGFLSGNEGIKLLFIGRESNATDKIKKEKELDKNFWMRKVWDGEINGKEANNYKSYLTKIREYFKCENDACAYMNINKRGGYSQCDYTRLDNYVAVYSEFIKKEIELIGPEIIVFLGVGKYKYREKLRDIIKNIDKNIKCYEVYHPSAPGKESKLEEKLNNEI